MTNRNKYYQYYCTNSGFSLTELSVVLVIIGILIASITTGQHLLKAAKMNKVIAEIKSYSDAVNNFETKYKSLPGDMPNAEIFWSTFDSTSNINGTINGNENGVIDTTPREDLVVFQHLAKSGLISGNYYPSLVNGEMISGQDTENTNIPEAKSLTDNAGYWILSYDSVYGTKGNSIQISSKSSSDPSKWSGGAIDPENARLIDKKIDDGLADSGKVFAINDDSTSSTSIEACVDGNTSDSSSQYLPLHSEYKKCQLIIWLNKF